MSPDRCACTARAKIRSGFSSAPGDDLDVCASACGKNASTVINASVNLTAFAICHMPYAIFHMAYGPRAGQLLLEIIYKNEGAIIPTAPSAYHTGLTVF